MNILFVENHTIFAQAVIKEFLGGHSVELVASLEAAKKELAGGKEYAVALIDYDLDDCKGSEVASFIKNNHKSIKMVATSSHIEGNELIIEAGAHAICSKMRFREIEVVIGSVCM